jgi:two-component system, NarL family, nitrate/nitrite response regulator NarL
VQSDVCVPAAFRVCILSPIRFYREGLAQLLAATDDITVVEASAPESSALDHALALQPDVMLIDIASHDGLEALHWFAERAKGVTIVAVAVSEQDTDVHECARAGVAGYVTRDASLQELIGILTSAARGELRCSAPLSSILRRELAVRAPPQGSDGTDIRLTSREFEILRLMGQDLANKEIARRLTIEVSTVKSHVHNILEKLRVQRRADAVMRLSSPRYYGVERSGSLP